jgi:hypothetical protein
MTLHHVANPQHFPTHFIPIATMRRATVETLHGMVDHQPPKRIQLFYAARFHLLEEFCLLWERQISEIMAGSIVARVAELRKAVVIGRLKAAERTGQLAVDIVQNARLLRAG